MKTILHCDANNFYASVEGAINPHLRGKPLAVSGNPEKRHGIILAKSQEAKAFGVSTGETIWQAKLKCPNLILVLPRYNEYVRYSNMLFDIYTQYTDKVESFGIDECWLDCSESTHLFGSGKIIADELRKKVREQLDITLSVGVSFSKIFAKLGSDMKKPDATTIITEENYKNNVWTLPVQDLMMVGRKTAKLFTQLNINSIGDLANADLKLLTNYLGISGAKLKSYANGDDQEEIRKYFDKNIPDSIGNSTTTPSDITTISQARAVIVSLSEMVATRLRQHNLEAGGISFGIKYNDLTWAGKQQLISQNTNNADVISNIALSILKELYNFNTDLPIRAFSVSSYKLAKSDIEKQISLFDIDNSKSKKLDTSVDNIRNKYGYGILKKGITIAHNNLCDGLEVDDFQPFKK